MCRWLLWKLLLHKWNSEPMQDITNMVLFARTIKAGSISAAARDLGMPKSTLSRRLTELEREQGIRLVHRTTRKLTLTEVGKAFLVHCQAIDEAAEAAADVSKRVLDVPRGDLRVSCPYAVCQSLIARVLPQFMQQYPEVKIHLVATNKPVNLIDEGIDVAIRVRPKIEDSALVARPISPAPTTLYASPDFVASAGPLQHPLDLMKQPTLSLHYSSGRYALELQHASGEAITITHQPRLITDDMWVIREAAAAGQGIAALPNYLCREYVANNKLVRILPEWSLPAGIMHLVYPHRRGLLPAVRVFVDYLVEQLPLAAGAEHFTDPRD